MKFLVKTLVSVLAIVGQWNFVANASVSVQQCMGMCNVELGMSCTEAIEKIYFGGDCCSLKEVDGICRLLVGTNSSCYEQYKDQDPCHYDEDGNALWCVGPEATEYHSSPLNGVDEPCPESEFEIPTPETTDLSSDGCGETICPDGDELPPRENNNEAETPSICMSLDTCLDCLSVDCKWTGGSCQPICLMDASCFATGEGETPESVCPATIPDEGGWFSPDADLSPSSDPTSAPKSDEATDPTLAPSSDPTLAPSSDPTLANDPTKCDTGFLGDTLCNHDCCVAFLLGHKRQKDCKTECKTLKGRRYKKKKCKKICKTRWKKGASPISACRAHGC